MKILFFTPHVALWVHAVPEAYLAKALSERGHDVSYMTCGRAQNYCAPMMANGLAPGSNSDEADRVCRTCEGGVDSLRRVFGFPMQRLVDYLEPGDREECELLASRAVKHRVLDTRFHEVQVGKLALYEFTLAHKKISTDLTDLQWMEYRIYLGNALVTLRAFSRYLDSTSPDAIATFSPQYSNINSCMQFAINRGIKVLFMESGTNLSHRLGTMRVWDWKVHKLVNPALAYWGSSARNPVTKESAGAVVGHFRELLNGLHFAVFSAPYTGRGGIRSKWPIRQDQRVLLMTLSSYDEAYAALLIDAFPQEKVFSSVFRTQAEWVKATIEWIQTRQDLFLVIRVHPRDFPNKREQVRSEQSFMLEGLLQSVPENVHVNWPMEGISLYELLGDTDVILTGWSVTAMEGLVLGIPVVTYDDRLPSYPSDIMWTGRSGPEYFANIDRALAQGWSIDNVTNGFRWLAYNFVTCTVTVSNRLGRQELANRRLADKIWTRVKNRLPRMGQTWDLLGWRDARDGAQVVDSMLTQGFDSIPAVRGATRGDNPELDDREVIANALSQLHDLLYGGKLPQDTPSLSKNIRNYLLGDHRS